MLETSDFGNYPTRNTVAFWPGETVDEKLIGAFGSGLLGVELRKIIDDANREVADEDKLTIETLPQRIRAFIENSGGEVSYDNLNYVLFGIRGEDARLDVTDYVLACMRAAGMVELGTQRDRSTDRIESMVRLAPTPKQRPATGAVRLLLGSQRDTISNDRRIVDGYYVNQWGVRMEKAPEPISEHDLAAKALLAEIRAIKPRPLGKKRGRLGGKNT